MHQFFQLQHFFSILFISLLGINLYSQNQLDSIIFLSTIELRALKLNAINQEIPRAVTQVQLFDNQNLKSQVSLGEYMSEIPGVFSLNKNNYAQDIRVSIRGFGSRAAFGIRGIKLVVDGIPETTPDGQGQVDNIPLGLLNTIEVLRGPSASIYGNAAGGVIYMTTIDSLINKKAHLRYTHGANNLNSIEVIVGLKNDATSAIFYQNLTNSDGYRNHSQYKQRIFNAKISHHFNNCSVIKSQINFTDSPIAQDAGGLTFSEYQQNRAQARSRNIQFNAYETIQHFKLGSTWYYQFHKNWSLMNGGYLSIRDFYGQLPFFNGGIVSLDRFYFGINSRLSYEKQNFEMQFGFEYNDQNDERKRFENNDGIKGSTTFDQTETFSSSSLFWTGRWRYNDLAIQGGLGYHQQSIGASSIHSKQTFNSWNPTIGLGYKMGSHLLFIHSSSSFETPTLSEFSSNLVEEGLNFDLEANRAWNYEIGWKRQQSLTQLELVLFHIITSNEIIPYEASSLSNRILYRNSGKTHRTGIELFYKQGFKYFIGKLAYSYSNISFQEYTLDGMDLSGNRLPGLPLQQLNIHMESHQLGPWKFIFKGSLVGNLYADDFNQVKIDPYQIFDISGRYGLKVLNNDLNFIFGVQNLFNEHYSDNLRINAFGNRFYEPAPLRTYYVGITLDI